MLVYVILCDLYGMLVYCTLLNYVILAYLRTFLFIWAHKLETTKKCSLNPMYLIAN